MKILHLQTISELMGIPIVVRVAQEPRNLGNYIQLIGKHCKVPQGGGIRAKTVYRNVYALCRWLNCNVLGISHVSSFYTKFYMLSTFWWLRKKIFACATHYWTPLLVLKINERHLCHYPFLSYKFVRNGYLKMNLIML